MNPRSLREYKESRGLTIRQLAEEIGVSAIYMAFLLTNKRRPSPSLAKVISEKTGIPILNLLYPQDEARP